MTRIMPRSVVERISNDTASDGVAAAVRDWMHARGWMRVGIIDGIMSVVQPYAATQYYLTTEQRRWIENKKAENNISAIEFNTRDIVDAQPVNPSRVVQQMISEGTSHWD